MKRSARLLLLAALAAAVPAHAATFVKDVMLIGHPDEDEIAALKSTYTGQGWTVIDQDLNAGAGGDFIYLLCKTEANPDNVNDGYITDFAVYTEGGTVPESQTYDGRDYRLVPFDGGLHFESVQGDLNSNAGGASIHLYYTTDAFPDDRAVTNIWFSSSSSGAVGKFGETDGYDLNRYADGDFIYMHAPAAHSPLGLTVNGLDIAYASGTGWTFDGATVSLTNAGPFVLSTGGENFTSNVAVVAQADCAVTFSNLEVFAGNHAGLSPFTVAPGVSVALSLEGNTVLTAGSGAAAITVVSNATGVASLTIDADATDTLHTLGANGGNQGAGIGGGDGEACGSVTILGGLLTVEGGANAAGIGGGRNGAGGTVTISGGLLNVKSAGSYVFLGQLKTTNGGAAIGGGYQGPGGMTAISGGTMSLTGVGGGAAIGSGKDGAGGTTAITGGSILARGGAVEPSPSNGVARVWPVAVSNLVNGAAPSLPWLPAGYGTNDLVAVGGEVCVWLPTGDYLYGAGESDGEGGWRRHAILVDAEGNVTLDGWATVPPLGLTVNGRDIAFESGEGWTFDGGHVVLSGAGPFVLSTAGETFSNDVGIVAAADCAVTFSNLVMDVSAYEKRSPFTVTPGTETSLTLVGTNSLAAGEDAAGLTVVKNGDTTASLVIDAADTNQTLTAKGGFFGAGIGGGFLATGGTVTINGGTVTATGGEWGAGIGGTVTISGGVGDSGGGFGGSGGTVAINGGTVTATGGDYGAGIGGGDECSGGTVTISDGAVTATGGKYGAGIGGGGGGDGFGGSGGTVAINGGTVTATGGEWGAGIGGGSSGYGAGIGGGGEGSGGMVTISGGAVTATGGVDGAGIGGGYEGAGGTVTINGGTVTATGGEWGAGIGGTVTISGGVGDNFRRDSNGGGRLPRRGHRRRRQGLRRHKHLHGRIDHGLLGRRRALQRRGARVAGVGDGTCGQRGAVAALAAGDLRHERPRRRGRSGLRVAAERRLRLRRSGKRRRGRHAAPRRPRGRGRQRDAGRLGDGFAAHLAYDHGLRARPRRYGDHRLQRRR